MASTFEKDLWGCSFLRFSLVALLPLLTGISGGARFLIGCWFLWRFSSNAISGVLVFSSSCTLWVSFLNGIFGGARFSDFLLVLWRTLLNEISWGCSLIRPTTLSAASSFDRDLWGCSFFACLVVLWRIFLNGIYGVLVFFPFFSLVTTLVNGISGGCSLF
jgi:hypothetical protein